MTRCHKERRDSCSFSNLVPLTEEKEKKKEDSAASSQLAAQAQRTSLSNYSFTTCEFDYHDPHPHDMN